MKYSKLILIVLSMLVALVVNAQKLPSTQQASLHAPANIKIDGKPTEWNKFQAYNHNTDIFYTLSNDDEKLYFTVQATDPDVINRIVGGGITLTVQKSTNKKDKSKMSITYPIIDNKAV